MRLVSTCLVALPLTLAVVACAGDDDGAPPDQDPGEQEPGTPEDDLTAPFVVSSSPADGALGVRSDAVVVIQFSEPMDGPSVEGALLTTSLGDVTLSWNPAGDALTITPIAGLAYAEGLGLDPDAIAALQYNVVVGTAPVDRAGNPIEAGYQTLFKTLRSLETTFEVDDLLTGSSTPAGGQLGDDDTIVIGDDIGGTPYRGFVTFDMSALPAAAVEVAAAAFATRQTGVIGAPYASLGTTLQLEHVSFDSFAAATFDAAPHATMGTFAESGQVVVGIDVTAAAEDDRANRAGRGDRSQYRLRFELATDDDGTSDLTVISRELAELTVTYLVP